MLPHPIIHQDFAHQDTVASIARGAPAGTIRDLLAQILAAAQGANIPWMKLFSAFTTMAAGAFSPAAILAGLTILFGANIPPALKSASQAAHADLETHAKATMAALGPASLPVTT